MKTIGVRIAIPEDLHTALSVAAKQDERKLAVFIVRLLKNVRLTGSPASHLGYAPSSPARLDNLPSVTAAVAAVPQVEIPLADWTNEQLAAELQAKRSYVQKAKTEITSLPAGPETERRKVELDKTLQFIGVLEREFIKRSPKKPIPARP